MSRDVPHDRECRLREGCEFPDCECPLRSSIAEVRIGLRADVEGLAFATTDRVREAIDANRPETAGYYAATLRELCGALECLPLHDNGGDDEDEEDGE